MGAWGSNPWDDDQAADWFGELFEETRLAEHVEKALKIRDVEEYAPEIRAAAYVLSALGHNYVWPVEDRERHLRLAIAKLKAIRKLPDYEGMAEIDEEIAALRSRLEAPNAMDAAGRRRDLTNGLADPDPAVRRKAARAISALALNETSPEAEAVLGTSEMTWALTTALADPDPVVAEEAVIALAQISLRYLKDDGAYPAVIRLLAAKRIQTRAWAVRAAGYLRGGRALDDLLPLLRDRAARVRHEVLTVLRDADRAKRLPAKRRAAVVAAVRPLLKDKDGKVRGSAATVLGQCGGAAVLEELKQALMNERDRLTRESMERAIQRVETRG